jgi:single-strand DNA-binding protein
MFETTVTLVGRLITPLKQIRFADGTLKVSGRMACTERRFDRTAGEWTDGQTLYVTVVCKRGLAENAFLSLRSLDPVIAHGRLYTREYEKDGVQNSITELEAWSIGPDLQRCTAVLTKKARSAMPPAPTAVPGDDSWGSEPDDVPSDDPWRDPEPVDVPAGEAAVGV